LLLFVGVACDVMFWARNVYYFSACLRSFHLHNLYLNWRQDLARRNQTQIIIQK
jgi:hypothetical protein